MQFSIQIISHAKIMFHAQQKKNSQCIWRSRDSNEFSSKCMLMVYRNVRHINTEFNIIIKQNFNILKANIKRTP